MRRRRLLRPRVGPSDDPLVGEMMAAARRRGSRVDAEEAVEEIGFGPVCESGKLPGEGTGGGRVGDEGDTAWPLSGDGTTGDGEGAGADSEGEDGIGSSATQTPDPLFGSVNPARQAPHSMEFGEHSAFLALLQAVLASASQTSIQTLDTPSNFQPSKQAPHSPDPGEQSALLALLHAALTAASQTSEQLPAPSSFHPGKHAPHSAVPGEQISL